MSFEFLFVIFMIINNKRYYQLAKDINNNIGFNNTSVNTRFICNFVLNTYIYENSHWK